MKCLLGGGSGIVNGLFLLINTICWLIIKCFRLIIYQSDHLFLGSAGEH